MARPRKLFPDYPKKAHASGHAVIRVNGKDKYLGEFNSSESLNEYERLRAEAYIRANLPHLMPAVQPAATPQSSITVREVLSHFMLHAEQHYRSEFGPSRHLDRIQEAAGVLLEGHGAFRAADFGTAALEDLMQRMCGERPCGYCKGTAKRGKKGVPCRWCSATGKRKWARQYVNYMASTIKQIWDWAARRGLIPPHALRSVRGVRKGTRGTRESQGIKSVAREIVEKTSAASGPILADMIEVQWLADMRPEEVVGMQWEHVRRDGILEAVGSFPGLWVYEVPDDWNKNAWRGQARVVMLGPKAQTILSRYIGAGYVFNPRAAAVDFFRRSNRSPNFNHGRAPGDHYTVNTYGKAIKRACKRAGVTHWSPLQLRHTRATEIRSLYSPDHARVVLGHHLAGVTGRYAEEDLSKAAQVAREIG